MDRLWRRGIGKEKAHLAGWLKILAPSTTLQKQFGQMAERLPEFSLLYREELLTNPEAQTTARQLIQQSRQGIVTLLYGAKDLHFNQAIVLKHYLKEKSHANQA